MLRAKLLPIIPVILLFGCSKTVDAPSAPTEAKASTTDTAAAKQADSKYLNDVPIDLKSPDMALKTWWRHLEAREIKRAKECLERKLRADPEFDTFREKIVTPELFGYLTKDTLICERETHDREILEVKVESETRAVIRTRIKITTPIPEGVVLSKSDTEELTKGTLFRYTLEKDEMGWKIARVDRYNDFFPPGQWEKVYKNDKPYYSTLIVLQ